MARASSSAEQQIRVPVSSDGFNLCGLEGHGAMILRLSLKPRLPPVKAAPCA